MNAQCATWVDELPDAICMLNVHAPLCFTMSPVPVVMDGLPRGIVGTALKEIYTRPPGVMEPIMYWQTRG